MFSTLQACTRSEYRSIPELIAAIQPSVVMIRTVSLLNDQEQSGSSLIENTGVGSGFVYRSDGYILTNHHVIANATDITVSFYDKKQYKAVLVGTDNLTDLAVLKIDAGDRKLPALKFSDPDKIRVGQTVVAAGSPVGLDQTYTSGIISAVNRDIGESFWYLPQIQSDVAINPGNSGGPSVNMNAEVIGINSTITNPGGVMANAGLGFLIPAQYILEIEKQLRENGK